MPDSSARYANGSHGIDSIGSETPDVRHELLNVLARTRIRNFAHIGNAALIVYVLWGKIDSTLLLSWIALVGAVALYRYWRCGVFVRRPPTPAELARWERMFFVEALVAGGAWGVTATVFWLTPDTGIHLFVAFAIGGMSAAAAATSYADLPSNYAFVGAALAPLIVGFAHAGDPPTVALGVMIVFFAVFLLAHSIQSNKALRRAIELRRMNDFLVADLTAARDGLERRVRERTAELETSNSALHTEMRARMESEARLRQAQKMEAIGRLTGGIAHDFNNLLAVIRGNAELLADGIEYSREAARTIVRSADRGAELIHRMLAFSRRQTLRPRPLDPGRVVANVLGLLDRTLGEKIELRHSVPEDIWGAYADPGELENAIVNLAINARDAMPEGGTLIISCANVSIDAAAAAQTPDAEPGTYVALAVEDTGAGMSQEVLAGAFDPFFTTKEVGKGSGLGLSMVYGFAKQSNGHVTIESAPGRGTTVTLFLPRAEAKPEAAPEPVAEEDEPRGKGECVLLLEDDAAVRDLVTAFLLSLGYKVVAAPTAADAALDLLRHPVDLLLSDVVLPGDVNGPAFAAEVRIRNPGLPVVFMSGYTGQEELNDPLIRPDDVLLTKPFRKAQLARVLRKRLRRAGGA